MRGEMEGMIQDVSSLQKAVLELKKKEESLAKSLL
jgi:hypothetical protein